MKKVKKKLVYLACGHREKPIVGWSRPVCTVCWSRETIVKEVEVEVPDRVACCHYCGKEVESNPNLPFFRPQPDNDYDDYYCGCWGWN